MSYEILQLGNPKLYDVSLPVKKEELAELEEIIKELHNTIIRFKNIKNEGIAISAPQIGVFKRIIYLFQGAPVVFINPRLEFINEKKVSIIEECMSFPGLGVKVERYENCVIKYKNLQWEDCEMELYGFLSFEIQHEYDHLDGILSTMRAVDSKAFYFEKEIPEQHNLKYYKNKQTKTEISDEAKVLLFVGDSITDCNRLWGDDPRGLGEGYVRKIAEDLDNLQPVKVINKGFNGFMIQDLKSKWKSFLETNPDVITVLIGINDAGLRIGNHISMARLGFREDYEYIIKETLDKTNAKMILMSPFVFGQVNEYAGWRKTVEEHIEVVRDLADKYQLSFLDLDEIFVEASRKYGYKSLTTDGIHLTPYGHAIIADEWCKIYKNL